MIRLRATLPTVLAKDVRLRPNMRPVQQNSSPHLRVISLSSHLLIGHPWSRMYGTFEVWKMCTNTPYLQGHDSSRGCSRNHKKRNDTIMTGWVALHDVELRRRNESIARRQAGECRKGSIRRTRYTKRETISTLLEPLPPGLELLTKVSERGGGTNSPRSVNMGRIPSAHATMPIWSGTPESLQP